jgi:hypothetical protein
MVNPRGETVNCPEPLRLENFKSLKFECVNDKSFQNHQLRKVLTETVHFFVAF